MKLRLPIILLIALTACQPNFRPEDSPLGPIVVTADVSDIVPPGEPDDNCFLRLGLYCYDAVTDSLVSFGEVITKETDKPIRISAPRLQRNTAYNVSVIADWQQRISADYTKQLWYKLFTEDRTNLRFERTSFNSYYDAIGYYSGTLYPGEEGNHASITGLGKFGRVEIQNYDAATEVQWAFKTSFRFSPFNPGSAERVGTCTSDDKERGIYYIPTDTDGLLFGISSAQMEEKDSLLNVSSFQAFVIKADALTGAMTVESM